MCEVELAEPWEVCEVTQPVARVEHRCSECVRVIRPGEQYKLTKGKYDGEWNVFKTCGHCNAAGDWLVVMCSGWVYGQVYAELVEHWRDGYASVEFGRMLVSMKNRWHDGADPVPTRAAAMAREMLQEVAA